jgi:hypothetical protein
MLVTRATKWPPETKRDATKRAPDPGAPQHHGKTLSRVLLRATLVSAPRSDNKSRAIRSGQLARMRTARILDDYSHPTPASPGEHYGSTNCNSLLFGRLGPDHRVGARRPLQCQNRPVRTRGATIRREAERRTVCLAIDRRADRSPTNAELGQTGRATGTGEFCCDLGARQAA